MMSLGSLRGSLSAAVSRPGVCLASSKKAAAVASIVNPPPPAFLRGLHSSSSLKSSYQGVSCLSLERSARTSKSKVRRVCALLTREFSSASEQAVPCPSVGDSITEVTINHWKKAVGQYVEVDDVVVVVDSDKISVDINSPVSGALKSKAAEDGAVVSVGDNLFTVDTAAAKPAVSSEASTPPPSKASSSPTPKQEAPPTPAPTETPKKEKAPSSPSPSSTITTSATEGVRGEKRVPMTRMRMRIAERLKSAQNTAAVLTTFNECDMGNLMALRSEMNDSFQAAHGVKIGFVSAFLKASTMALQRMPNLNAYIDGNEIVYKDYIDISVAVATPNGLLVPVIRDCQGKSIADLERDLHDLAKRARSNQIALEEMTGGSFTVSNGGVYGSMLGTPILNPPQSSILGMHAINKRAVVKDNQIVIRPMMYLALTYDHRLIDGREAVSFLCAIRDYIEEPRKMLLDI